MKKLKRNKREIFKEEKKQTYIKGSFKKVIAENAVVWLGTVQKAIVWPGFGIFITSREEFLQSMIKAIPKENL